MRKTLTVFGAILVVGLVIVGVAFQQTTFDRADFAFINGTEPKSLDPAIMTGQPEGRIAFGLYEGLTYWDPPTLENVPGSAESWTVSPDEKVWTFKIRKEAR